MKTIIYETQGKLETVVKLCRPAIFRADVHDFIAGVHPPNNRQAWKQGPLKWHSPPHGRKVPGDLKSDLITSDTQIGRDVHGIIVPEGTAAAGRPNRDANVIYVEFVSRIGGEVAQGANRLL